MSDVKNLQTAILRFRDLVTARGQTIQQHQDISEQKGMVWWGWWSKLGETVPDEGFRSLTGGAKAGGIVIYLMDSGQELLYRALCTDIRWDSLHDKIKTPDANLTPPYYSEQPYLAWFQLRDIDEEKDPIAVLVKYSYLRVDEFFEDKQSRFVPFYGKQVSSVRELRQQDRTIWFLKEFEPGEPRHEILFQDAFSATPQHFPRDFFQTDHRELLWVSDLHFSQNGHHAFPLIGTEQVHEYNLGHRIESTLEGFGIKAIAGVIISGDITWKADESEFEMSTAFIRRLATWTPLRGVQIAVCPGNHDLKFSSDPAVKDAPIGTVGDNARKDYSKFYQDLFYLAPNEYLTSGRRFLLGRAAPVEIVCLNSSWLQQEKGLFQGHGFIGEEQLAHAQKEMGWDSSNTSPRAYRIVVLHHHILPTTYRFAPERGYPYSVVLDTEALVRWLGRNGVSLVLHGHMHQPFCARVSRPLDVNKPDGEWHEFHVVGMGSTGVSESELGETKSNVFGILRFARASLMVSLYTIHSTNPSALLWQIELPYPTPAIGARLGSYEAADHRP